MSNVGGISVNVNEGIRVQEMRSCFLCGSPGTLLYSGIRDRLFGVAGTWTLVRCPKCHLVWLDPCPVSEDIGKLYERYASHAPPERPGRFARFWKDTKSSVMAATLGYKGATPFGKALSRLSLFQDVGRGAGMWLEASSRGKLLDVGCGSGQFLAQMAELEWQVTGVEPDGDAVKVAQALGLDVRHGMLEDAKLPENSFDAVTLHHVIEHVLDPVSVLQSCWRVLKPGGQLIVVAPNVESLSHQRFGSNCFHLDPPRHLIHFSAATLRETAVKAGIRVHNVSTSARTAGGSFYMSRLLQRHGVLPGLTISPQKPSPGLLLEGVLFWVREHLQIKSRPCGEEVVMVCRK
jgi:2-polyprenyl-3-methyl-5-hydroxy-6-metoxy-1,4-benzoquinol methylase